MELRTWTSLKTQLLNEVDGEDEEFVSSDELKQYFNDGVDMIEAEIHKLGLDSIYFEKDGTISLVSGTAEYAFPSDIYANKITKLVYVNGTRVYEINRLRGRNRYSDAAISNISPSATTRLQYVIVNNASTSADNRKLRFYPTPQETLSIPIWYIRQMNKWASSDSEVCDLPEFYRVLIDYVKWRYFSKEQNALSAKYEAEYEKSKTAMIDTLADMVEDADNELVPDADFYEEHT